MGAEWFWISGLSVGIGSMVSHQPGSNEFLLRWEPNKLIVPLLTALIGTVLIGSIRWRMWRLQIRRAVNSTTAKNEDTA